MSDNPIGAANQQRRLEASGTSRTLRDLMSNGRAGNCSPEGKVRSVRRRTEAGGNDQSLSLAAARLGVTTMTTYTAYAGVTRTDIASGANVGINGYKASAATLSLAAVQTAYGATWFGNEHVDLMPTTQVVWDVLWNKIQPQQRFLEESSDVARVGQLQALLGSDPFENGGEVEEPCDGNLEPSIAFDLNAKARVETMGHPLVKQGEEIVRATGNNEPVEKPFQALRYNGASIVVDQYAPSGVLWFLNLMGSLETGAECN